MKIMPINNISKQNTQFKAKFPTRDLKIFLEEAKYGDIDTIPKLYTMLDVIKKQSGEKASIKNNGLWFQIHIDGESMNNKTGYFCALHALQDATVNHKNTLLKKTPIERLSDAEFEEAYCKNRKKTIQDVENIYKE